MPDRADHGALEAAIRTGAAPGAEAARRAFAAARIRTLGERERRLLELAVRTPDDSAASWLELWADDAWRDARAMDAEHRDDGRDLGP